MRSAFMMVERRWATVIVVRFFATLLSTACTIFSPLTSIALVASSIMKILGFLIILLAMAMR